MIQRDLERTLITHLTRPDEHRNITLLEGARQVGKSTLIEALRPKLDRKVLYLDLAEDRQAADDINRCHDFADFEHYLAAAHQFAGDGQRILCIDEAQESQALGRFVRYMTVEWRHTPVVLIGSSLPRVFGAKGRLPVERVTRYLLQPFSFREFLRCGDNEDLLDFNDPFAIQPPVHDRLLMHLQSYLDVGGLPAVAVAFFAGQDWRQIRRDLYLDYRSDFARIFSETESALFDQCLRGVASNLGSPSKYSQMARTTTTLYRKVPDFLDLLESWKLVHKLAVHGGPQQQNWAPKRHLYDLGLANDLRLTPPPRIDILESLDAAHRAPLGGLIENLLAMELIADGQDLNGWKQNVNSYEVDFVYKSESGDAIPVVCKAALHTLPRDSKGLAAYAQQHGSSRGVLVNLDRPGTLTTATGLPVLHIPAYMVGMLR